MTVSLLIIFIHLFLQNIIYMSNLFISYKIPFFSLFQIFLLRETLHDIVALTQYDLDKLKPIEKLGREYLQNIQTEMSEWKEWGSGIPEDQAQEALLEYVLLN